MLGQFIQKYRTISADLRASKLYDQNTFYKAFLKDLAKCRSEVIIESPFITCRRLDHVMPTLVKLKQRRVKVLIVTRDPRDSSDTRGREDATEAVSKLQRNGMQVVYVDKLHRKIAVMDGTIVYEGSLNILSQNSSNEVMRRIGSAMMAQEMIKFIDIRRFA